MPYFENLYVSLASLHSRRAAELTGNSITTQLGAEVSGNAPFRADGTDGGPVSGYMRAAVVYRKERKV